MVDYDEIRDSLDIAPLILVTFWDSFVFWDALYGIKKVTIVNIYMGS